MYDKAALVRNLLVENDKNPPKKFRAFKIKDVIEF